MGRWRFWTVEGRLDEEADYQAVIDIAWRHQFNDDRPNFKRDIRELQQHVSRRALEQVERDREPEV